MANRIKADICIIGAGSGGLSLAAGASQMGSDVVLIESGKMGGDCLNYGCVPSKAIIAASKYAYHFRAGERFGVKPAEPEVDFQQVHDHIHSVIAGIEPHDSQERFESIGVNVIREFGKFISPTEVQAGDNIITARRFVICTGSSAAIPPIPGLDTVDFLTNESLFENTVRPEHLMIIGGGPIGMEMAQAHRRLGSKVTVMDGFKALGRDDPDLAGVVLKHMRDEGVEILEDVKIEKISQTKAGKITVHLDGQTNVSGSHLLVAAGRKPNLAGMDLEKAGIEFDRRGIKVDARLRSTNKKIFAIGDVAGGLQFTHVAGYHAGIAIRNILFRIPAKAETRHIPWVTYTDPEMAHVGMTQAEATEKWGEKAGLLNWSFEENDRARADLETDGKLKAVLDPKGRIVGCSIVGKNAGELINTWALAVSSKLKVGDMAGYISPYPTMGEVSKRAAGSHYTPKLFSDRTRKIVKFLSKFG